MPASGKNQPLIAACKRLLIFAVAITLLSMLGCSSIERRLLFFPSHHADNNGLTPWNQNGNVIGFSRNVTAPKNIWLLIHGNAGQAADREYALDSFSPDDSVFILEYPGYGKRAGTPSMESFNAAAKDAYLLLRQTFPKTPVCVAGESIGSGPACFLATLDPPPEKIVLVTPFRKLSEVAREHFPNFLVKLLLKQNWDNAAALERYQGPVHIFAAANDNIIPDRHARALADAVANSRFISIKGGHNDWSIGEEVKIRNP